MRFPFVVSTDRIASTDPSTSLWFICCMLTGEFIKADKNGQMIVPEGAVVVAGSRPISKGPGADKGIHLYTPVIVKYRDSKTDSSVTLESVLRD